MTEKKKEESPVIGFSYLLPLLLGKCVSWASPSGDIFVDTDKGVFPLKSQKFKGWIYDVTMQANKAPTTEAINEFSAFLEGVGMNNPRVVEPRMRVMLDGEALYYDLGGKVVRVADGRWEIGEEGGLFYRGQASLPQVEPSSTDKDFRTLFRELLPLDESTLLLLQAWLLGCFLPGGPFPILILNGEQGSAKSTTTRMLARLIDPHHRDMREPPRSVRDLASAAKNSYVLAFDNVSHIPPWLSDSFCRIATGTAAIGGRKLYTDTDEASVTAARPMIFNGIPDFVEREDLADRSIHIYLPTISESQRRDDDSVWSKFEELRPLLLGSLLNMVAKSQAGFDNVHLSKLPRMANFCRWVVAGIGSDAEQFLAIMHGIKQYASEQTLENNPVAQAVLQITRNEGYEGTVHGLLGAIAHLAPDDRSWWPSGPRALSNALRRLQPVLREAGVEVVREGRENGTGRTRIRITRRNPATPS